MDSKRRGQIVGTLNEKYAELTENLSLKEAYKKIVTWKPYKALSCFVYNWTYYPLKRGEMDIEKPLSPKPKLIKNNAAKGISRGKKKNVVVKGDENDEKEFVHKSHRTFIQNLRLAQHTSIEKKKKVEVIWRDYRTFVEPNDPIFTHDSLRERLVQALKDIMTLHKIKTLPGSEQKVFVTY